ncbi:AMP deaminase [Thozetella sp. PMI_491]|nr:AMP deaminase [Thozetella sp. PMI_491]
MQFPVRDSDDEDEGHHLRSATDSGDESSQERATRRGERGSADPEGADELAGGRLGGSDVDKGDVQEGMLPRDMPKRTVFYDPVAERQMTQSDAKLFYQRSQLEGQRSGTATYPSATSLQASPVLTAGQSSVAGHPQHPADLMSSSVLSLGTAQFPHLGPSALSEAENSPLRSRDASYFNVSSLAAQLGSPQQNPLAGLATSGHIDPAVQQQQMLLHTGAVAGVGSTTYADADPQITTELSTIFQNIHKILDIRHKYMRLSLQGPNDNPKDEPSWDIYPPPPEPAWGEDRERLFQGATGPNSVNNSLSNSMVMTPDAPRRRQMKKRKPGQDVGEDFDIEEQLPLPVASEMTFRLDDNGVYQVYENPQAEESNTPIINVPTIKEYYLDLEEIMAVSTDGPSKSFAFRRLQYLEGKFNLYVLLNEYQETADSKKVPHRDFYNVRKVDTHVHHSACMNQKHLLRFIKSKMKKSPDEIVLFRDGKNLTLKEVFESINLTAYDLSIDTLDMHAHTDSFHRFDKFNLKYNPIGESRLRTIFLKTDNFIQGRYLAEITKEVIADLESSKYQMVEWRISIYGKSMDEWDMLAAWVIDNKLFSHNVRWLIQIPRLYDVYKATGLMDTYEQVVKNIFQPLFEVTKDPASHPKLHIFLQRVIGFDSVDDESKVERRLFRKYPVPKIWDSSQNPPYSYWIYYLYSNMVSLNAWRKQQGLNTFVLRPHCGEAGDPEHLSVAVLCAHSISHGLLLRKMPMLQYIFYLEQIGIAMSPLSNNALFLAYERNPFHQYFKRGLNVSLSTDDPLQFAFTKEPLIEEYAVAAQIYKLSPVDMCELARNSVLQSGYEASIKQQWLGPNFRAPGAEGNMMVKTNVPDRRVEFRYRTLLEEQQMVERYTALAAAGPYSATSAPVELNGSASQPNAALRSPAASLKTNGTTANAEVKSSLVGNASSARTPATAPQLESSSPYIAPLSLSGSTSQLYGMAATGLTASPIMTASDGIRDLHLSGDAPRYFPGVVTRSQRRNSTRQGSMHETDTSRQKRDASVSRKTEEAAVEESD